MVYFHFILIQLMNTNIQLIDYAEISSETKLIYWAVFLIIVTIGGVKIVLTRFCIEKGQILATACSMGLGILAVLFFGMARGPYAVVVAVMLLVLKGVLLFKCTKSA